ncbi:MAG: amidohydrolase family protein [Actinomycetota bacterium]|nr:amidohydrolase family protein [Actinomycetota bacterium]
MIDFIDFHVHPPVTELLTGPIAPYAEPLGRQIDADLAVFTIDEVAAYYRDRNGKAVLLGWDTEAVTRRRAFSSEDVAAMVAAHPDMFYGFGSIDPARGAAAVAGVHTAARLGLAGLAFHPIGQDFDPSSRSAFTVYEAAAEHGLICLFHTGYSRLGSGMPGGTGLRLSRGDPRAVDEVAATFPDLQIVIAHLGRLWRDEAVAVAAHKSNVWLNLVGTTPSGCLDDLDALAGLDFDRCLFGSDWCFASLDDALAAWHPGSADEAVRRRVLHDNATRLLGLTGS